MWICSFLVLSCCLFPLCQIILVYLLNAPEKSPLNVPWGLEWSPLSKMPLVALARAQVVFTWVIRVGQWPQGVWDTFFSTALFSYKATVSTAPWDWGMVSLEDAALQESSLTAESSRVRFTTSVGLALTLSHSLPVAGSVGPSYAASANSLGQKLLWCSLLMTGSHF